MAQFEIIQHPLDKFSLTGSMADLDGRRRDSADQLMTMIGDLQVCRNDIRGTCARYFFFIDRAWFWKLCLAAHIDFGKLHSYLLAIDNEETDKSHNTLDDPQASFCFPENENQSTGAIHIAAATNSETPCANNAESKSRMPGSEPTFQKPAPKMVDNAWKQRLG